MSRISLLTTAKEIDREFRRCIEEYDTFYWMTAWATMEFPACEAFLLNQYKCRQVVVGTHFFQTHPDFVEAVRENKGVRFIKQTSGVFHPKTFLFFNSKEDWKLLVGSANFTHGAFGPNLEMVTVIDSSTLGADDVYRRFKNTLDGAWKASSGFSDVELEDYRASWRNMQSKIRSLSGYTGGGSAKRARPAKPGTFSTSWSEYMRKLNKHSRSLEHRLRVLEIGRELFRPDESFRSIELEGRKFIAGIPNKYEAEGSEFCEDFGSMKGSGGFKKKLIAGDLNITKAMDCIPVSGQVIKTHYEGFLKHYCKAFNERYLATGTRLLSMKRPDIFCCLTSKNKSRFSDAFGIPASRLNLLNYWDEVVERICDTDWWINPKPANEREKQIAAGRAAFLDVLYYEE